MVLGGRQQPALPPRAVLASQRHGEALLRPHRRRDIRRPVRRRAEQPLLPHRGPRGGRRGRRHPRADVPPQRRGGPHDPGHHRQAGLRHPQRHQGGPRPGGQRPDERRDHRHRRGSADSYDLQVEWATRVTWSGEYVHAAPWSVGSQGKANVSHGCTGMSTENAKWFFDNTRVGDIVQVVNSLGHEMEPFGNGYGDWNISWTDYVKHSATGARVSTAGSADTAVQASGDMQPQP
ncbi:L,D-transpeptidase [Kitasatospora arboriphila]